MSDSGIEVKAVATAKFSGRLLAFATVLAAGALLGCATISSATDEDIFYASQAEADADLARFEVENPSCQLWTNWQKICSRSEGGENLRCATDASRHVKPSLPFCVSQPKSLIHLAPEGSQSVELSKRRFCDGELVQLEDRHSSLLCGAPKDGRPFSGRDLNARRSSLCIVWSEEETGRGICAEGGQFPELPRCSDLAEAKFRSEQPLYCSREALALEDCPDPQGIFGRRRGVERPSYLKNDNRNNDQILAVLDQEDYIIHMNCGK